MRAHLYTRPSTLVTPNLSSALQNCGKRMSKQSALWLQPWTLPAAMSRPFCGMCWPTLTSVCSTFCCIFRISLGLIVHACQAGNGPALQICKFTHQCVKTWCCQLQLTCEMPFCRAVQSQKFAIAELIVHAGADPLHSCKPAGKPNAKPCSPAPLTAVMDHIPTGDCKTVSHVLVFVCLQYEIMTF